MALHARQAALAIAGCNHSGESPPTPQVRNDPAAMAPSGETRTSPARPIEGFGKIEVDALGFDKNGISLGYQATYVGADQCAKCHADLCEAQKSHHMARTGAWITAENRDQYFSPARLSKPVFTPPGQPPCLSRYESSPEGIFSVTPSGPSTRQHGKVDAVLGSDAHATTPITFHAGRRLRELPVTYSTGLDRWIRTPGQPFEERPWGILRSAEGSHQCLSCHATVLAWRENDLDRQATVLGVSCERCHGPGSAHVEAMRHNQVDLKIFNAGRRLAQGQVEFCAQCHRTPADMTPIEVLTGDKEVARHAGAALMLSACYRKSSREKSITCLDCHSPHVNINRSHETYNSSCLRCHASPAGDHPTQQVNANSDCVSCHMPTVKNVLAGADFASHWIRNPAEPLPLTGKAEKEYLAFLETEYRARLLEEHAGPERLHSARLKLAEALLNQDRIDEALEEYRVSYSVEDFHVIRLGVADALFKGNRPRQALAQYRIAARNMPDDVASVVPLARALATADDAQCRNGPEAVKLAEALAKLTERASPEVLDALAAAYAETGEFSSAKRTAEEALALVRDQNNALAGGIRERIKLYQAGKPFRDPNSTPKQSGRPPLHLTIKAQ